jgi:hypothetical protein
MPRLSVFAATSGMSQRVATNAPADTATLNSSERSVRWSGMKASATAGPAWCGVRVG